MNVWLPLVFKVVSSFGPPTVPTTCVCLNPIFSPAAIVEDTETVLSIIWIFAKYVSPIPVLLRFTYSLSKSFAPTLKPCAPDGGTPVSAVKSLRYKWEETPTAVVKPTSRVR